MTDFWTLTIIIAIFFLLYLAYDYEVFNSESLWKMVSILLLPFIGIFYILRYFFVLIYFFIPLSGFIFVWYLIKKPIRMETMCNDRGCYSYPAPEQFTDTRPFYFIVALGFFLVTALLWKTVDGIVNKKNTF